LVVLVDQAAEPKAGAPTAHLEVTRRAD